MRRSVPGFVEIWDATKAQRIRNLRLGSSSLRHRDLAWSPDESTVVTYFGGALTEWSIGSESAGKQLMEGESTNAPVNVQMSPSGQEVTLLSVGGVEVMNLATHAKRRLSHARLLDVAGFDSVTGRLAVKTEDTQHTVEVWDVESLKQLVQKKFTDPVNVVLNRDATWVAMIESHPRAPNQRGRSSIDIKVALQDLRGAQSSREFEFRVPGPYNAQWSPDGRRLAIIADGYAAVVGPDGVVFESDGSRIYTGQPDPQVHRIWSSDGKFLLSVSNGAIDIRDSATGTVEQRERLGTDGTATWIPGGHRLIWVGTTENHSALMYKIWSDDGQFGDVLEGSPGMRMPAARVSVSDDGSHAVISASRTNDVWVVRVSDGKTLGKYTLGSDLIADVAWLPDQLRFVFLSGESNLGILDIASGEVTASAAAPRLARKISISHDVIAVGGVNQVAFYDHDLQRQSTLVPHGGDESQASLVGAAGHAVENPTGEFVYVALDGDRQQTMSPDEFKKQTDWTNDPGTVRRPLTDSSASMGIVPGQPMSEKALVSRPAPIAGIDSWTLETADHRGRVFLSMFSPSGTRIATAGEDDEVRIWDASSRALEKIIVCPGFIFGLTWSPDEKMLATLNVIGERRAVLVWDVQSDVRLIRQISGEPSSIEWLSDGTLAVGGRTSVQRWDALTGIRLYEFETPGEWNQSAWAPDAQRVAIFGQSGVTICNGQTGKAIQRLDDRRALRARWSPSGKYLATLETGLRSGAQGNQYHYEIVIWDPAVAKPVRRFVAARMDNDGDFQMCWSPDETRMATHNGASIHVWDPLTGEPTGVQPAVTLSHSRELPVVIDWNATGELLVYSQSGGAMLCSIADETNNRLAGHNGAMTRVSATVVGDSVGVTFRGAASQGFKGAWLFDPLLSLARVPYPDDADVSISPDGKRLAILAATENGATDVLTLVSIPDLNVEYRLEGLPETRPRLVWSPDGSKLCLCASDRSSPRATIRVIDSHTGKLLWESQGESAARPSFRGQAATPPTVAWSPDSTRLAWWSDARSVSISHAETGDIVHRVTTSQSGTRSVARPTRSQPNEGPVWSQDGRRLAYADSRGLAIWDFEREPPEVHKMRSMFDRPRQAAQLALSPDGTRISEAYSGDLYSWTVGGQPGSPAAGAVNGRIHWHTWSADSRHILFRDSQGLAVLSPVDGNLRRSTHPLLEDGDVSLVGPGIVMSVNGTRIDFWDDELELIETLLVMSEPNQALLVQPDGQFQSAPGTQPPFVQVISGGVQKRMTLEEMSLFAPRTNAGR